jgi:hypothetical protein
MSKLETNTVDSISGTSTLTLGGSNASVVSAGTEVRSNKLSPASGTALQIGDSGDTITIPSGATIANSGTATGFGETNTPAFDIRKNSYQTISNATSTKVTLDVAALDTDSGFDSGNNRWTVPSGKAGTYYIAYSIFCDSGASSNFEYADVHLAINGTATLAGISDHRLNYGRQNSITQQTVIALSVGDYLELFGTIGDISGSPQFGGGSSGAEKFKTHISGFRIIAS